MAVFFFSSLLIIQFQPPRLGTKGGIYALRIHLWQDPSRPEGAMGCLWATYISNNDCKAWKLQGLGMLPALFCFWPKMPRVFFSCLVFAGMIVPVDFHSCGTGWLIPRDQQIAVDDVLNMFRTFLIIGHIIIKHRISHTPWMAQALLFFLLFSSYIHVIPLFDNYIYCVAMCFPNMPWYHEWYPCRISQPSTVYNQ